MVPRTHPAAAVAIVDPLTTGRQLAKEFAGRGWAPLAVLSRPNVNGTFQATLDCPDFVAVIDATGRLDDTLSTLDRYHVRAAVPGSERGVEFTDLLADTLGLPGNGAASSAARRDKYEMAQTLARAELRVARTATFAAAGDLIAWADTHQLWPIVVKPRRSAGTDSVYFCTTAHDVRRAVSRIVGSTSRLGERNDTVCAQELLVGEQFYVNTVSLHGRHRVSDIWHDRRRRLAGHSLIYDTEELMPHEGVAQSALIEYTKAVLDVLRITTGPAHTEIMLTGSGPVLIEINARVQGKIALGPVTSAIGHNQVSLTVDAVTDPVRFATAGAGGYRLRRQLRTVCLIAPCDGTIRDATLLSTQTLPSLAEIVGDVYTGQPVSRTVDLFTTPAVLFLLADSAEEIDRDTTRIRSLERDGFYLPAGG